MKRTNEALYLRPPDDIVGRIPLGLDVDAGQTKGVLVDHAVDATVTAAADSTSPLLYTAIAHRYQNVQNGLLEEVRSRGSESFEQLSGHLGTESGDTGVDLLDRIEIGAAHGTLRDTTRSSYAERAHGRDRRGSIEDRPHPDGAGARQAIAARHQ